MLSARIKVMSNLDIAEKRVPQDGRMSLKLGEKWIDIRVSTLPSSHGEKVVLRILDKAETQLQLEQLGMDSRSLKQFESSLKSPNGIILVTGPTGSGKTTTLYAGLNILNDKTKNILTVEDPIEYAIEGVTQTQVNTKVGMTFAKGLRAILRQDPDIIMLGEIRDLETAEIAIQASLTGHLVLSTVHTNDSVAAITRMIDIGIESYLLASTLKAVLAQRLVRKLCSSCKEPLSLDSNIGTLNKGTNVFKAKGCDNCKNTGYKGRVGIFELFLITDKIKEAINTRETENRLSDLAFSNENKLSHSGYDLLLRGVTSLEEILRVTSEK
jgi:general secretion pathway protein E